MEVIYTEVKSIVENDTFELVDRPSDAWVISCRTILRNNLESRRNDFSEKSHSLGARILAEARDGIHRNIRPRGKTGIFSDAGGAI